MSFYVKSTPEVAKFLKTKHDINKVFVVNGSFVSCDLIENTKHYSIPEYKLHPKHGFVPTYYNEIFLDNAPDSWSSAESPEKMETKQQNEKSDQKEENENMDSKEEFPVVGQKVVILNTENYTLTPFGEGFVGKDVTVVSKFTTPENDYALPTKMVSVLIDELDGYSGVCACFRENMCYPVKTEREKEIEGLLDIVYLGGTINEIAERLYNEGYRKLKD